MVVINNSPDTFIVRNLPVLLQYVIGVLLCAIDRLNGTLGAFKLGQWSRSVEFIHGHVICLPPCRQQISVNSL